jgi:mRNA interferase MazF
VTVDPIVGHVHGGTRPAVVVSGDRFNGLPHSLCVVAPITSTIRDIPTQVPIHPPEAGLTRQSVVMCDQLRTISLDRLEYRRGSVDASTMETVRAVIARVFDL